MYSVADEEEAKALITLCCPRDHHGTHYARELAQKQTIENLQAFSDKLHEGHKRLVETGYCRCKEKK